MSHEHEFNAKSTDAMFAMILTEVRGIKTTMTEVRDEVKKTNGRVRALENEKWYQRGVVAAISVMAVAAWELVTKK